MPKGHKRRLRMRSRGTNLGIKRVMTTLKKTFNLKKSIEIFFFFFYVRGELGRGDAPLHGRMPVNRHGRNDGIRKSFCNYQFNSLTRPKTITAVNHWVKGTKCCNLGVKVTVQLIFKGFIQNK